MSLLEGYRLFTGYYIYESEMPSEAKLEFVKFLKEASADDIMDILSGQYEAVQGLTEEEMEAVHQVLDERFGKAGAYIAKKAVGAKGFAAKHVGITKAKEAKAALKAAKGKVAKGVKPGSVPAVAKAKKGYGKAVRGAVGRVALATTAVGGAGYGGYRGVKAVKK